MARDLRRYARQTNVRLFVGFLMILFIVGDGIIWVIWGREAALLGLACLLAGLAPLGLIFLALWAIEWVVKKGQG
jgi:hypothetical protein